MRAETSLNPPTSALPFEMFRTFSSIEGFHAFSGTAPCEISETERVYVLKFDLPVFKDAENVSTELKSGVLTVTFLKREETKTSQMDLKWG